MAFIPVDGVASVEIRADHNDVPVENVLHFFTGESPATESILVDLAGQVASSWTANVMPLMVEDYTLREIHARDLTLEAGAQATDTTVLGQAGELVEPSMPGNVAFCVSLRTGIVGRSFRGRIYLAGQSESRVVKNVVDGTHVTALVAAIASVRADLQAVGFTMVIASRFHNGAPRLAGVATGVSAVLAVTNRVSTQRRRLT